MEEWKNISDFPDYECSNLGNFRRSTAGKGTVKGKPRKSYANPVTGYHSVTLSNPGESDKPRTHAAHKVIARTWIPNPNNHPHVGFRDGDKSNLSVENLYWHPAYITTYMYCVDLENLSTRETYECVSMSKASKISKISPTKLKSIVDSEREQEYLGWRIAGSKLR